MKRIDGVGWVNNEKNCVYQTPKIWFKVKKEVTQPSICTDPVSGFEVYINDKPGNNQNWRPIRFFSNGEINRVKQWVERFAERVLAANPEVSDPSAAS